jgi:Conjugative transposon protein TcpC
VVLSRVWNARLLRWRSHARTAGMVALSAAALFGVAAAGKVFLAPDRPDIAVIAQRVGNQGDQVGAFAADFVVTWLTATTAQRTALQRFITLADNPPALPTTPAAVVTAPQVVSVIHTGTTADADVYAATVSVTERAYASAQSVRSFYRVPVSMWNYQPRALTPPARINGPGPGADFTVGYQQTLSADSPVYALVRGFLTTYLTATTGLDRYVLADSGLMPVGGYQTAIVSTLSADGPVPDNAAPGTRIHVLATVIAQTAQFAIVNLVYPLTVENSGGTWMVAEIDLAPQIDGDAEAADTPHN